jgi:hypothetical protein
LVSSTTPRWANGSACSCEGREQIEGAALLVIVDDVVGELRSALTEEGRVLGPGHQHGVEEVG